MSNWQRYAEVCAQKFAENLFRNDPHASLQTRYADMWKAGAVLLILLRKRDVPEHELNEAMSLMLNAYVMHFRQLQQEGR